MLELPGLPPSTSAPEAPRWFVGRNAERHAALSAFAEGARLVTLVGLGGVGKTTLAQRLARDLHSCPHPAVWVDCSLLTHASHLMPALAVALRLPSALRTDSAERLVEHLAAHLRSSPALLVLDNLEQLHDAFAPIAALLHASPDVRLLATSRSPLHLSHERLVSVPPFRVPDEHDPLEALRRNDAVTLFVRHARTVRPSFDLTARNAPDVVRLCRRLDGLPLALELAARHMDVFTPDTLLTLLNDHALLLEGDVDRHERHRSLQALLDGTYALLDDGERRVYRHLALFGGTFDALDVHALLGAAPDEASSTPLDLVRTLLKFARGGLLVQGAAPDRPTFRMLETLRVDAWRRLETARERAGAERAHARHFRDLLRGWKMPLRHEFLRALSERRDDLHRAFEWFVARPADDAGATRDALAMGRALATLWAEAGALREGEMRLRRALARPGAATADRAATTIALAFLLSPMGRHDEALRLAEGAEGDLDDLDDHVARVVALDRFASVCAAAGAYDRARAVREQLIALKERRGFTPMCVDRDRMHLAALLAGIGEHEEARAHFVELVERAQGRQDHWNTVVAALGLSASRIELGELDGAEAALHLGLAVARGGDFPRLERHLAAALLHLDVCRGATPETVRRLQDAAAFFEDLGHRVLAADCLVALGFALLHVGRPDEAHEVARGRVACARLSERDGPSSATAELLAGASLQALDRPEDAERFLRRALGEPLRRARPLLYALGLLVLAEGQERLGRADEARALRGREDALVRERGLRRWPIVQARRDAASLVPATPPAPAAPGPRSTPPTPAPGLLSVREQEVLSLLGAGRTNKQIGKALSLSENTVRAHARSIFQKVGGRTRTEVVASALRLGLLGFPPTEHLATDPTR